MTFDKHRHIPLGCPWLPVPTAEECLLVISNRLSDISFNRHLKRLDVISKSHLPSEISLVASEQLVYSLNSEIKREIWVSRTQVSRALEAIREQIPELS